MNKHMVKYEVAKNKKRKRFKLLIILVILFLILGILYVAIISKSDKLLIKNTFQNYFTKINKNNVNYSDTLINNLCSNVLLTLLIWIMGISIIGTFVSILYLCYKAFVLGFTISSLLYVYGIKVIPVLLIYIIPLLVDLSIIFILTFYAIGLSRKLYVILFQKKKVNLKKTVRIYTKFLIIMIIILIISSIFATYMVPNLIKSFTKSLI